MNRQGPNGISYLDWSWSVVVGCTHGCPWCWARRQAKRQKHRCQKCYDFVPHYHPERLDEPLRRKKPSVIGVAFMGDLFDPALADQDIWDVLGRMEMADWHRFVVLTKQSRRASGYVFSPNVVLGVSITDQPSADRLIPELLECQAATRIVSIEPMLGPVDLWRMPLVSGYGYGWANPFNGKHPSLTGDGKRGPYLDGVILGGQTGPGAAPLHPDWVRKVRDDCAAAGVPFFLKSLGPGKGRVLDGRTHDETAWEKAGEQ